MESLALSVLPDVLAICRLDGEAAIPEWTRTGGFVSITRTAGELSVVCPERNVPKEVTSAGGWRCLRVEGPLDLALTGILASLAAPLARAGISTFAVSTYDTDYLLVRAGRLGEAIAILRAEGHRMRSAE